MLRLKTFHTGIIWTYWVKRELWFRGRSKHISVGRQRVDIQICSFLLAAAQTLCLWGEVYNGAYSGNADNHHWNILKFWSLRGGGGVRSSESAKIILFLYKMVQVTFKRFCFSDVIKSCALHGLITLHIKLTGILWLFPSAPCHRPELFWISLTALR